MKRFIFLFLAASIVGCAIDASKVPNSIPIAQTNTATAEAHLQAAESGTQATIPHADATGQALLSGVSTEHKAVGTALAATDTALASVQKERDQLMKDTAALQAQVTALLNSWGHKFQVICTELLWIIIILFAIHVICIGLSMFLPPPYSLIAGTVGKVVNPLGWGTWIIARFEKSPAPLVVNPAVIPKT